MLYGCDQRLWPWAARAHSYLFNRRKMKPGKGDNPYKIVKKKDPVYKAKRFGSLCYVRKQPKALLRKGEMRGEPGVYLGNCSLSGKWL